MKTARQRSLSQGKGKFFLDWDEYIYYINRLIRKIKQPKIKFDSVYGVPRDGLFPATIISHQLDIEFVEILNCRLSKNMLIVDDICDTGETLQSYNQDKVVLIGKPKGITKVKKLFCAHMISDDTWAKFDWEVK